MELHYINTSVRHTVALGEYEHTLYCMLTQSYTHTHRPAATSALFFSCLFTINYSEQLFWEIAEPFFKI